MPSDLISKSAPDLKKQLTILALVLVVETLVIGGAYLFMLRTVGNRTEEGNVLAQRRAELVAQLKKQEDVLRDAVLWNKQRKSATETLAQHVYWTDAFAFLESVTLPTVSFKSFSGDADTGIMTLDATAKSYRDLAEQIVLLRSKPQIFEVKTTAASAQISEDGTIEGVSFSLSMKVDPRVWHSRQ